MGSHLLSSEFIVLTVDQKQNQKIGLILQQIDHVEYRHGGLERTATVHFGERGRTVTLNDQESIDRLTRALELFHARFLTAYGAPLEAVPPTVDEAAHE